MAQPGLRRQHQAGPWCAIALMSMAAAFSFSPNLREGPLSSAERTAERVAAAQVVAAANVPASGELPRAPQPLLAGADHVPRSGAATHIRVAAAGIDADVRGVGYLLVAGQLQYDVPRLEAGQYTGSADPGQAGNLVIAGHVANRGAFAVFSRLPEAKIGDVVEVFSGAAIFRYSITELRVVAPDATAVMARTQDATLTLITCSADQDHRNRLIVVGKLI
jgi:LPXTG-site transpeptidase (sortase) family protein